MRTWCFTVVFWGSLLLGDQALAQSPGDPAALAALRSRYQKLLVEAESPARLHWLAALEELERQKAASGDFEGAAAVRAQRLSWLKEGGMRTATAAAVQPVLLKGADAKTKSGVEAMDQKKESMRFRRNGASLEWELPGQIPGTYQVSLVCGVTGRYDQTNQPDPLRDPREPLPVRAANQYVDPASAGGVVEFRKAGGLNEGVRVLRCSVRSTGGWTVTRSLPMGAVTLDNKSVKFSLKAVDALPAGVMDFYRLELVPDGNAAEADVQGAKELARLKEVYQKQSTDLSKAVNARYLKGLADLEISASRSGDNETLALVRQERKRLEGAGAAAGSQPETPSGAGKHVLPVTEKLYMLLKGEVKLTNQGDYLTRMRPAKSCEVLWKLAGLGVPSGTYAVALDYRVTAGNGGSATLFASSTGTGPSPGLSFEVAGLKGRQGSFPKSGAASKTSQGEVVGRVVIPKGSQYLTLRVDSLTDPGGSLFDLKAIGLMPLTTP
jgi:hypothetical protein